MNQHGKKREHAVTQKFQCISRGLEVDDAACGDSSFRRPLQTSARRDNDELLSYFC